MLVLIIVAFLGDLSRKIYVFSSEKTRITSLCEYKGIEQRSVVVHGHNPTVGEGRLLGI